MKNIITITFAMVLSTTFQSAWAQPVAKNIANDHELSVTNLTVFVSSAYSMNSGVSSRTSSLNSKSLFRSTLPSGSIISRRVNAESSNSNQPMPLGMITFRGIPSEDVDVLLEFKGRNLAHWIPARKLSGRLYWRSVNLTKNETTSLSIDKKHWLNILRPADALTIELLEKKSKALLYDLEVTHKPDLKLVKTSTGYKVSNGSDYPVHDVVIFEPEKNQEGWKIAYSKVVPSGKQNKASNTKTKKPAPKKKTSAKPAGNSPVAGLIKNVFGGRTTRSAKVSIAEPKKETGPPLNQFEVNYLSDNRDTSDVVLKSWSDQNSSLGLTESEMKYVLGVLKNHALLNDQATVVYRFDDEYLDKLLPLEITPAPDRLKRVSIVILQDADPRQRSEIENLIAQLGNESWVKREEAYEKLKETGLAAREQLQKATKHSDLEIVLRAERLLDELAAAN